jgi:hypothetical protein
MSFAAQQQDVPGVQARMDPVLDRGENRCEAREKLTAKKAINTGIDSGIGRAVAIALRTGPWRPLRSRPTAAP